MKRIESLDWQRGLLALSIMLYHLIGWKVSVLDSSSFLGRLGIYGVSMFFVLSGLSMALVYHNYIASVRASFYFFVRRVFRIWPLLWLVIGFAVLTANGENNGPSWKMIVLNLTTAFGFISPSSYFNVGAWSIGNEMVYYALTPAIIYLFNKKLIFGNILVGVSIVVGLIFSTFVMNPGAPLAAQWINYVNPFNNLFLYYSGIAIYYNFHSLELKRTQSLLCFAIPLLIFFAYPVEGNQIHIVTGLDRVVFCFAAVILVLAFYKNQFDIPQIIARPITHLGVLTYGIYLLHPVAYQITSMGVEYFRLGLTRYGVIGVTILITFAFAQAAFTFLEMPCIRIGKKLTRRAVSEDFRKTPSHSGTVL